MYSLVEKKIIWKKENLYSLPMDGGIRSSDVPLILVCQAVIPGVPGKPWLPGLPALPLGPVSPQNVKLVSWHELIFSFMNRDMQF